MAGLACVTSNTPADDPQNVVAPTAAGDHLVVGFNPGVSGTDRIRAISAASGREMSSLKRLAISRVAARRGDSLEALRRRLETRPEVRYVEPDYEVTADAVPSDPLLLSQWGLSNPADHDIDAFEAWDTKTKCSKVAVLDTGVDLNHPDLVSNLYKNSKEKPDNGKDDDDNGYIDDYIGVNVRTNRGDGVDTDGHGTHVAGIVAGVADNGIGVSGVCWKGSVMSVKFMNALGKGSSSYAAEGIEYAVHKGVKIINASFGSTSKSSAMEDAIEYAKEKGVLIVVAAGNDGKNIDKSPVYPASYTYGNILTVAASTLDDGLASFSNYGEKAVDVAAPGENITSTYIDDIYKPLSGTSMAAPMVAGMAGLLRAKNSDATYSDLKTAIRRKVDKPPAFKDKVVYDGRANLKSAIDYIATL
ncbi:MAG: S8 family serine peptidase [Actinobacteria bacterium]|nr:S8 family serine peptidase [Actinomycetota bacterium]